MAARIRDERALLHLLGLSAKPPPTGLADGQQGDKQQRRSLLLARALSPGGRRTVRRYWQSHSDASELGGLGPVAALVADSTLPRDAAATDPKGMPPRAFERLFACRPERRRGGDGGGGNEGGGLSDWPAWRVQGLRDALDPKARGLLSAEALGLAVAMLAASGSAGREQEEDERRRLRGRVWRALNGGLEEEEDEGVEEDAAANPSPIPLASVWTCALLMGAEERHLAAAWRGGGGGGDDGGEERGAPQTHLTAAEAEALVGRAQKAQALDPARLALSAPCCGFEWVGDGGEGGEEDQQGVSVASQGGGGTVAVAAALSPQPSPSPPLVRPAAPCCCVLS